MSKMSDRPSHLSEEVAIFNLSLPEVSPPHPSQLLESLSSPQSHPSENTRDDYEPEQAALLRAAECPICRSTPTIPIFNCQNGHFACNTCRPRLPRKKCPLCQTKFTKMRNFPLENIVTSQVFLCDFRDAGCKQRNMTMGEYENHLRECWFRPRRAKSLPLPLQKAESDQIKCPRCTSTNSKRKVKCQECETNLRVPTPPCRTSSSPPFREITNHWNNENETTFL